MANICEYKVIVKGKKNACYAFYGSMSAFDKWVVSEEGTDDNFILKFEGNCKWYVDCYCNPYSGNKPVILPEDSEEAYNLAEEKFWYHTVQERSEMFSVEVLCNSADVDDYLGDTFEHYISGKKIYDNCPKELNIIDIAEGEAMCCNCYIALPLEELTEYKGELYCPDCIEFIEKREEEN